ncbi:MAG: zinc ribbon domain-containing protein [Planctomycetota bacterium]
MGALLADLLTLQNIEKQLAQVRNRLRIRKAAVNQQQKKIDDLQGQIDAVTERITTLRKEADSHELTLKIKDAEVDKLRTALNTAKTNKGYASILTQINTHKADNAKLEESTLKLIEEIDNLKSGSDEFAKQMQTEAQRLEEVKANSAAEIDRLSAMLDDLQAKRDAAAENIDPGALATFDRIAANYDGEAMAMIETHGKKPPYSYVCGGCFMGLTAEHANALATRDEIRTCDNCGRILYVDESSRQTTG